MWPLKSCDHWVSGANIHSAYLLKTQVRRSGGSGCRARGDRRVILISYRTHYESSNISRTRQLRDLKSNVPGQRPWITPKARALRRWRRAAFKPAATAHAQPGLSDAVVSTWNQFRSYKGSHTRLMAACFASAAGNGSNKKTPLMRGRSQGNVPSVEPRSQTDQVVVCIPWIRKSK